MPSTLRKDRYGNVVDTSLSIIERMCLLGKSWRIDTGYLTLANAAYASMAFTTPATGDCFYTFASADKSGAEVVVSLLRSPTVSSGSPATAFNYDDGVADALCPLTDVKTGVTLSGGTERFISLMPGESNPATKLGANSRVQGIIKLRNSTTYAAKFLAKGAVTIAANVGIAVVV